MNFEAALSALKAENKVARMTWDAKTWLFMVPMGSTLAFPPGSKQITAPFVCMQTTNGPVVPWTPSPYDLLAENWKILS